MQTLPPDLGEQTLFGRLGLWLVGFLAAIFWAAYRAWHARADRLDVRLDAMDAETQTKATEADLERTERDVQRLFADLAAMRTEQSEMHGTTMEAMAKNREELKDLMHKLTMDLTGAMNRLGDRTSARKD